MNFKFPKSERLSSEKEISKLYGRGNKFTVYPFKVQWLFNEKTTNQIMVVCPKRNFKKAVDRNLIKRRMREAYRLNKDSLIEACTKNTTYFNIAFVFIGNEIVDSTVIHSKFKNAIDKLKDELTNDE